MVDVTKIVCTEKHYIGKKCDKCGWAFVKGKDYLYIGDMKVKLVDYAKANMTQHEFDSVIEYWCSRCKGKVTGK
jgi:hypothetical protein